MSGTDGAGLTLRPLALTDVPEMAGLMARNREHIGRYMRAPSDLAGDLVQQLVGLVASEQRGECVTVAVQIDGRLAGLFSLVPMTEPAEGHEFIGWIAADHLGRGAGRAALARLCEAAQEGGITTVLARIRSDNAPMNALAQAEGFTPVRPLTAEDEPGGYRWCLLRRGPAA